MKKSITYLVLITVLVISFQLHEVTKAQAVEESYVSECKFDFDGLMGLCFGNPSKASIGILDVEHHQPEVTITKQHGNESVVIAKLSGKDLKDSIFIDLEGREPGRVIRHQAASMEEDPSDFRWTIDMESDLFQRKLYLKEEKLIGKVHISAALFYAELLTRQKIKFFSNDGKQANFNRQIAAPAAKVGLKNGDTLVIKNSKQEWRLVAENGITYRIDIHNLPPPSMGSMDHFLFYYDFIGENVPHYELTVVDKAAYSPRPVQCGALIFSKSSLKD